MNRVGSHTISAASRLAAAQFGHTPLLHAHDAAKPSPIDRILGSYANGTAERDNVLRVTCSYIKHAGLEDALSCLRALKAADIMPNIIIYNILISKCGKNQQSTLAFDMFKEMTDNGIAANAFTYSSLMSTCEKAGRLDQALRIYDHMRTSGPAPDNFTYSALISACQKAGRADLTLTFFCDMRASGVKPDVPTYNVMIWAFQKAGRLDVALDVFHDMRNRHITPDLINYNGLISACGKAGLADIAHDVFQDMRANAMVPDIVAYRALILSCKKCGRAELALNVFLDMGVTGTAPDYIIYHALIGACETSPYSDQIPFLLQNMVSAGLMPASLGYCPASDTLDFHRSRLSLPGTDDDRFKGVSSAVAKAVFDHHFSQGRISKRTSFIVGQHGNRALKETVAQCMRNCGWIPLEAMHLHDVKKSGVLVSAN